MAKKATLKADMLKIGADYIKTHTEMFQRKIEHDLERFRQNHEVLTKLVECGIIPPEEVDERTLKWGGSFVVTERVKDKAKRVVGPLEKEYVEAADAKKRLIRVTAKFTDYPQSAVRLQYLHKYTKEEEAKSPCKFKEVEVQSAQEAQPAKPAVKEVVLVCDT